MCLIKAFGHNPVGHYNQYLGDELPHILLVFIRRLKVVEMEENGLPAEMEVSICSNSQSWRKFSN